MGAMERDLSVDLSMQLVTVVFVAVLKLSDFSGLDSPLDFATDSSTPPGL